MDASVSTSGVSVAPSPITNKHVSYVGVLVCLIVAWAIWYFATRPSSGKVVFAVGFASLLAGISLGYAWKANTRRLGEVTLGKKGGYYGAPAMAW